MYLDTLAHLEGEAVYAEMSVRDKAELDTETEFVVAAIKSFGITAHEAGHCYAVHKVGYEMYAKMIIRDRIIFLTKINAAPIHIVAKNVLGEVAYESKSMRLSAKADRLAKAEES